LQGNPVGDLRDVRADLRGQGGKTALFRSVKGDNPQLEPEFRAPASAYRLLPDMSGIFNRHIVVPYRRLKGETGAMIYLLRSVRQRTYKYFAKDVDSKISTL
jgi:hypothetical protein